MCNIICQLEPDEWPATLRTWYLSLCRIFFHMKTDNRTQATLDHPSITKADGRLFLAQL